MHWDVWDSVRAKTIGPDFDLEVVLQYSDWHSVHEGIGYIYYNGGICYGPDEG